MSEEKKGQKPSLPNHRLRAARLEKGYSHQDIADGIGLPDAHTVGRWESGRNFPSPHYRQELSNFLGKSLEELGLIPHKQIDSIQEEPALPQTEAKEPAFTQQSETPSVPFVLKSSFTSFVGREQALARVCQLLTQPEIRLLTILGAGGVGKTRLASEVALASRAHFAENICMVSCASLQDPALILPTIAREVHLHESSPQRLLANLQAFFSRRASFLLLLDNFEHLLKATPVLEDLLASCPRLKLLITSRAALHIPGEQEFHLAPLALPSTATTGEGLSQTPAVQLFLQRAQARLDTFEATRENLPIIGEICTALDGLPLAIELAAARVKLFSLSALHEEIIAHRLRLHNPKSEAQGTPSRHLSLAATIKWSYDLLDEQEQWLVRHLALFPGGCTLSAIRKIWDASPFGDLDAPSILMSLLDKSMIYPLSQAQTQPRFLMLETIREYCLDLLHQRDELAATREILASHCLELLVSAEDALKGPEQSAWLKTLDQERQNLTAALSWLIESKQSERALLFCEIFGKFCGLRGYWSEEDYWLRTVLESTQTLPDTLLRGRVLRRAAHLAYRVRDLPRARRLFEESCAISRELGDTSNLAGGLSGLAWVYYREHNTASVPRLLAESVDVARASGNSWSLSNALESQARYDLLQNNLAAAAHSMEESLSLARKVADGENLVRLLHTSITIAIAREQFNHAETLAQENVHAATALGNKPLIALAVESLAAATLALGRIESAAELYAQRMQLARELQDASAIAHTKLKFSEIALSQGKLPEAQKLAQESLSFFEEHGDRPNTLLAAQMLEEIARNHDAPHT